MNRVLLIAFAVAALAGCSNDPAAGHHGPPPKDPPDYHGVPTDDRPPSIVDTPDEPQATPSQPAPSQAAPQ
jgi:hypothetical protein